MKKIFLFLVFIALPLRAQEFGQVGTSGAQLLKINLDPRASGLGYAAASVVNNSAALYTNPAGIESIKDIDAHFSYATWFADLKIFGVTAAYRIPSVGVVGIQATGFTTDEEITTVEQQNGTGQRYSIANYAVGVSFARHITDKLALGIQAKYILNRTGATLQVVLRSTSGAITTSISTGPISPSCSRTSGRMSRHSPDPITTTPTRIS